MIYLYNPKAKLTTEVAQEIASLAHRSRRGKDLLDAPLQAASVVLTNGSAAGADYKLGQKPGSRSACNGRSVAALRWWNKPRYAGVAVLFILGRGLSRSVFVR